MLEIGHSVTRPGGRTGYEPVTINVPEELETVPGIVKNSHQVDFYTREYPLESDSVEETADWEWVWSVYTKEVVEERKVHEALHKPIVQLYKGTGEIEPTVEPVPGKDVTEEIKAKARELGFGEVGIARMDRRYVFKSMKDYVKFPHAICLAWEQDYESTQSAPSMELEGTHHSTYRILGVKALELAEYIRSLGYHSQVHGPGTNAAAFIPMFVEAGLGQLGANGQLLSPHFGSGARIGIVTTDALVTYDQPIGYGIHSFCTICQVCVNRCPGRALMREKIWWRGVEKHKLIKRRCRPVMSRYEGCAVCMKACPVQRYGMKPVMDHYAATGQVLGKGTDLLEGFSIRDIGYFAPGELPSFDTDFFRIPRGTLEDNAFDEFKEKIKAGALAEGPEGDGILYEFRDKVAMYLDIPVDYLGRPTGQK